MHKITENLLKWYNVSHRNLPWRNVNDPYKIWLSEVILQQTRVDQGLQYYLRFVENYPTVNDLASAAEEDVLKLWQGLGYYSRARNLHKTAQTVSYNFNGLFPATAKQLLDLPGIGPYTAAAVASIAFDECIPVVDGNVQRVIARLFNIHTPIDRKDGQSQVLQAMNELITSANPGKFNQAVMELGSLVCTPSNPQCDICPLRSFCLAKEAKSVSQLPVKTAKTKVATRYIHYLVIKQNDTFVVRQRTEKGIWQNLYDFPSAEGENPKEAQTELQNLIDHLPPHRDQIKISEETLHLLSHRRLHVRFHLLHFDDEHKIELHNTRSVNQNDFLKLPVPRIVEKFLPFILGSERPSL